MAIFLLKWILISSMCIQCCMFDDGKIRILNSTKIEREKIYNNGKFMVVWRKKSRKIFYSTVLIYSKRNLFTNFYLSFLEKHKGDRERMYMYELYSNELIHFPTLPNTLLHNFNDFYQKRRAPCVKFAWNGVRRKCFEACFSW